MRKFTTLFAVAALSVGTFALTGCEKEDTTTPSTGGDTMSTSPDTTESTMEGATTMPTTVPADLPATTPAP